jgi:thiol-disulfide isomerase/thioredoxin
MVLNLKTSIVAVAVVAFIAFLAWGLVNSGDGGIADGEPVPTATLPTLPPGGEGSLEDYRGEWVLLNVWASWCIPCREESPALDRFERENRDRVTVLGIDTRDLTDDALAFLEEYRITYDQLRDASGEYADDLETTGVPESFLVDPDGNLVAHFPGPFRDLAEVEEFAAPALASAGPAGGGATGS